MLRHLCHFSKSSVHLIISLHLPQSAPVCNQSQTTLTIKYINFRSLLSFFWGIVSSYCLGPWLFLLLTTFPFPVNHLPTLPKVLVQDGEYYIHGITMWVYNNLLKQNKLRLRSKLFQWHSERTNGCSTCYSWTDKDIDIGHSLHTSRGEVWQTSLETTNILITTKLGPKLQHKNITDTQKPISTDVRSITWLLKNVLASESIQMLCGCMRRTCTVECRRDVLWPNTGLLPSEIILN